MDLNSGALVALTLGFLLGLKHATDADHVVAVSTIVGEDRNAWRGLWVGGSWGLGHTTPLLILGIVILAFKEVVLDQYETVAPAFEFGVGIMLVLLGAQVFWNLRRRRLHVHEHAHDAGPHVHIHGSHGPDADPGGEASHGFFHPGRPFFRMKSYTIGVVHGLAGSAAVMLFEGSGDTALYDDATTSEDAVLEVLAELKPDRSIKTNVEFYTALLLHGVGMETDLFSPTFAVGRVGGWTAHILEQIAEARLMRPRAAYDGELDRVWVPVEERGNGGG